MDAPKRSQLTLDELHQARWLLGGALTLLGVVTVAYMDVEAWWLMALTAIVSLATTARPALVARVPRLVHRLAFPVIVAFFAADLWLRSELLPAMVRLDMLLLFYRALVYRQRRDDLQLIILGLFLVVVAGVLTVSLTFAVQIVAYTGCALAMLLVLTLIHGREAAAPAASTNPRPSWAEHTRWRRLFRRVIASTDWRLTALGGLLFIGLIGASAALFLAIPRFELDNGMFLDRFVTRKARSGFSDTIRFGDVTEIQQDTSIAMHVDVSDATQIPAAPYWRMLVLDDYHDGIFRMSPQLRAARLGGHDRVGSTIWGAHDNPRARGTWTMYLESGTSRYLPLLGPFRVLRFAEAQSYRIAPALGLVALAKDPVTMVAYQVDGFALAALPRDEPAEYYRERALSGDTRTAGADRDTLRRLVVEAAGEDTLPAAEFATRVNAWLRQHHAYSLAPKIPDGAGDPLVRWAASNNAGHCELFAGSFVLLARTAGFPARVVTGFRGGSWNAYVERSFTVRNSDAHAWAEIFDVRSGSWLRADPLEQPTAQRDANTAAEAVARRTDRSLAARFDSLRVFWYRRVVSFDQQTQLATLKVMKELAQSSADRFRRRVGHAIDSVRAWAHRPWDSQRALRLGAALLLAAGATLLWRWARQIVMRRSWRRSARREDPIRREAGRWLRRLPPAHLELQRELQRIRFGRRETWPEPTQVFRRARTSIR